MSRLHLACLLLLSVLLSAAACTPLGNLDAAGEGVIAPDAGSSAGGAANSNGGHSGSGGTAPSAAAGMDSAGGHANGGQSGGGMVGVASAAGGASSTAGGTPLGEAGGLGEAGAAADDAGAPRLIQEILPNTLANSPIDGDVSYVEATYSGQPTFIIVTPSATYTLLKKYGRIISIVDHFANSQREWIGYSDYRPLRSAGIVASQAPIVTTTVDAASVTARHVRLQCQSDARDWIWVWDFYGTQATLTMTQAKSGFGFSYRGTPGGQLDDADQLVLSSGQTQGVKDSLLTALPGPTGWAYLADPTLGHALFLIQHQNDGLADRYDSLDGDSASFIFGDTQIVNLPSRFSLGLVDSSDAQAVKARIDYVTQAVR